MLVSLFFINDILSDNNLFTFFPSSEVIFTVHIGSPILILALTSGILEIKLYSNRQWLKINFVLENNVSKATLVLPMLFILGRSLFKNASIWAFTKPCSKELLYKKHVIYYKNQF